MSALLSLIAAVAENGVIGKDNKIPWRIKGEQAFFKQATLGKPVVMGRRTWDSLPKKPLPGRPNLVVSRTPGLVAEGATVHGSLDDAIAACGAVPEIMLIGGAALYREAIGRADRLYLSEVQASYDGDTFFPAYDRAEWRETSRQHCPSPEPGSPAYDIVILDRLR